MEEALESLRRAEANYDPQPLKNLIEARRKLAKYDSIVIMIKQNGKFVLNEETGEPIYYSSIDRALKDYKEAEFYYVHVSFFQKDGALNEENVRKRLKNTLK